MEIIDNRPRPTTPPKKNALPQAKGGLRGELKKLTTKVDSNPYFRPLPESTSSPNKLDGVDQYGNRFLPSLTPFGFPDSAGEIARAGILVSATGADIVKKHTGFLSEIDEGLKRLISPSHTDDVIDLRPVDHFTDPHKRLTLRSIGRGDYSQVYKCEVQGTNGQTNTFAVKIPTFNDPQYLERYPFMKQMVQRQAIQSALKDELAHLGVALPEPYAASSTVMVEEYIEGVKPDEALRPNITKALSVIEGYIRSQKESDPVLWQDTHVDQLSLYADISNVIYDPVRNVCFLIDPLYY